MLELMMQTRSDQTDFDEARESRVIAPSLTVPRRSNRCDRDR